MTPTLTIIGIALWGQLLCGVVGFALGRITKRGPTRTVEVYEGNDIPF
jgi:hypothetical protein